MLVENVTYAILLSNAPFFELMLGLLPLLIFFLIITDILIMLLILIGLKAFMKNNNI